MADGADSQPEESERARLRPPVTSGRAALVVIGVIAAVAVVAGLVSAPELLRPARDGATASATGSVAVHELPVPADQRPALDGVLAARASALLRHDRAGWLATTVDAARAAQDAQFTRVTALPVVSWQYRLAALAPVSIAPQPSVGREGVRRYSARLDLTYRLAGDTRDVRRARVAVVTLHDGVWRLESEDPADDGDRDLWDLGALTAARGTRSAAVTFAGAASSATALAAVTDSAARAVDAVWGPAWPRTVVAVLPVDVAQMAAVLGRDGRDGVGGLDRLSAVTSGRLDRGGTGPQVVAGAADRVVLNPAVWARLTDAGRLAVLTHELTHVATRATTSATPPGWLDEGFATYVGYRGAGLPDAVLAAAALPEVRSGRIPTVLPAAGSFDPARGDPGVAYAQAWVACDLVVRRAGIRGLVELYRVAASDGGGEARADVALRGVLGESADAFVTRWRQRLRDLAGEA